MDRLAAVLCALTILAASARAGDGLAPRFDTRYQVIAEQLVCLDGSRKLRVPTLRALDLRSGGVPMMVVLYEQGEDGERALATVEGEDVAVERVTDLDHDGNPELVIRVGSGARCVGCSRLVIYGARRGQIKCLTENATIHDLADVDGDGHFEGLSYATSLVGAAGLGPDHTPRVAKIYSLGKHGFFADDRRYARWHWRELMETRRALEREPTGRDGVEQVSLCIKLYFEHEILGKRRDGLEIATWFLSQLKAPSAKAPFDRQTVIAAERALTALQARVNRSPEQ